MGVKVVSRIKVVVSQLTEQSDDLCQMVADAIVDDGLRNVAVLTGDMRSTYRIEGENGSQSRQVRLGGMVGANDGQEVDYAAYPEGEKQSNIRRTTPSLRPAAQRAFARLDEFAKEVYRR